MFRFGKNFERERKKAPNTQQASRRILSTRPSNELYNFFDALFFCLPTRARSIFVDVNGTTKKRWLLIDSRCVQSTETKRGVLFSFCVSQCIRIYKHTFIPLFAFIYKWYNTKTLFYFVSIAAAVAIFQIDYEACRSMNAHRMSSLSLALSRSSVQMSEMMRYGEKTLYDEFWASGKNSSDELPNGTYA